MYAGTLDRKSEDRFPSNQFKRFPEDNLGLTATNATSYNVNASFSLHLFLGICMTFTE